MKRLYIAYGSNLNTYQMKMRCPTAKVVGASVLKGYELLFKGSKTGAYLTIEKKENGIVPVGVWEVENLDERNLDRYEGYPTFYYKEKSIVNFKGEKALAFVYIMHENRELGLPSETYVKTCMVGYDDFGFDYKFIREAIERSKV